MLRRLCRRRYARLVSLPDEQPIDAFWRFWAESCEAIEKSIGDGSLAKWVEAISRAVTAIDPDLDWEFGAGKHAAHYFCLSAKGDPIKRITTERWRARGPGDGAVFEFHAARPGDARDVALPVVVDEHTFLGSDFRIHVDVDESRARAHLQLWHPTFASASEQLRTIATFITLDSVLGEDDVERWIGAVELVSGPPEGGVDLAALVQLVDRLRATSAEPCFVVLEGTLPTGAPAFVTANHRIKRADHLLMDVHVEVELTLREPTIEGLTTSGEAERLGASEDALLVALGHDAVWIARETLEGRRVIHFHVAQVGPAIARIGAWAEHLEWPHEIRAELDPTWEILHRW